MELKEETSSESLMSYDGSEAEQSDEESEPQLSKPTTILSVPFELYPLIVSAAGAPIALELSCKLFRAATRDVLLETWPIVKKPSPNAFLLGTASDTVDARHLPRLIQGMNVPQRMSLLRDAFTTPNRYLARLLMRAQLRLAGQQLGNIDDKIDSFTRYIHVAQSPTDAIDDILECAEKHAPWYKGRAIARVYADISSYSIPYMRDYAPFMIHLVKVHDATPDPRLLEYALRVDDLDMLRYLIDKKGLPVEVLSRLHGVQINTSTARYAMMTYGVRFY